ncbi:glycosyltransferase family 9 protein [bacterium]|nr:glycosyltransferase family 9 protein [candidate division CSSED10-310 bacterium]
MLPRLDCRYYKGEKPCSFKRVCDGCPQYEPMGIRVLILKLGAMGDALRTTPILTAYRRKYQRIFITWVTDRESFPILKNNPLIDRLLINDPIQTLPLLSQEFDIMICLDKDPSVTALAMQVQARERFGFAMSPYGTPDVFNDASLYALRLGVDDYLKFFENTKTYQQIIYEMAELPANRDPYVFALQTDDRIAAHHIIETLSPQGNGPRIGLNTGCGTVFATKKWPMNHFVQLARLIRQHVDGQVFLLGGPGEEQENRAITDILGPAVTFPGIHPLGIFAGLLGEMDAIVTSDTMALHLGLAVGSQVIGLFGPTCAQEIDFYGKGEPVVVTCDCSPCYRKTCKLPESCMTNITPEHVMDVLETYLKQ